MVDKEEKKRRRELTKAFKQQERVEAEARLPIDKSSLAKLFDYLDQRLQEGGCDHTLMMTLEFITKNNLPEGALLEWFRDNGGYCDCEVLANVENCWE